MAMTVALPRRAGEGVGFPDSVEFPDVEVVEDAGLTLRQRRQRERLEPAHRCMGAAKTLPPGAERLYGRAKAVRVLMPFAQPRTRRRGDSHHPIDSRPDEHSGRHGICSIILL